MQLIIDPVGTVRYVYDETVDLAAMGNLHVKRASHVEPNAHGRWTADLGPVGSPTTTQGRRIRRPSRQGRHGHLRSGQTRGRRRLRL